MATNRRTLDGAMDRRSFIGGSDARIIMGGPTRRQGFTRDIAQRCLDIPRLRTDDVHANRGKGTSRPFRRICPGPGKLSHAISRYQARD
jgi:hypothetical protein